MSSRSLRLRAFKRKVHVACGDNERVTRTKKALLSDDVRLNEAIGRSDFLAVKEILEYKDQKLSKTCLQASLLKAAEEGNKPIVQLLVSHGVCVKGRSKVGCLALIAAAKRGYLDIVKLLVKKGAPVDGKDSSGKTALMVAVEKSCCSALITFLLEECQAGVNLQDNEGKTALMLAVEKWDYGAVQILFFGNDEDERKDYNCDEGIKDKYGRTALDLAKMNGSAELMSVLSESRKELRSPLSIAAGRNNLGLVRRLVETHPSCVESWSFGAEPLTSAMHGSEGDQKTWDGKIHCSFELFDFLVRAGVNVDDEHLCGYTPLMFAAAAGADRAVDLLLSHKADVNQAFYQWQDHDLKVRTALRVAAQNGWVRIVEMLIQAGANLEEKYGENALSFAVKGGHRACVQVLLKTKTLLSGNEIEIMAEYKMLDVFTDVRGRWNNLFKDTYLLQKVLCKAIQTRCHQLVKALVEHGADVNFHNPQHHHDYKEDIPLYPLYSALDDFDMMALLVSLGADINIRPKLSDKTALIVAACNGNKNHVQNLLKCNADMYAKYYGFTALSEASVRGHDEIVTALLDHGMDVNYAPDNGLTALWYCLNDHNYNAAESLIKRGANVNHANEFGSTILMYVIEKCDPKFSELIIKSGADINAQIDSGDTALFRALKLNMWKRFVCIEKKVSVLLQHGANVNHINLEMKTPLMVAAEQRSESNNILQILLDTQPDLNAQDINGDTALHLAIAVSQYNQEKVEMLANKGADMNIVNLDNRSPLMVAVRKLYDRVVKTLIKHGASINKHNSQVVRQVWRDDVNFFLRRFTNKGSGYRYYFEFRDCAEALLEAGFTLHEAIPSYLDKFLATCINEQEFKLITLLVKSGVGPNSLDVSRLPINFKRKVIIDAAVICNHKVSPLCMAILVHQPKTVALFAQACFYHQDDVKILQHPLIKEKLSKLFLNQPNLSSFTLDDLCPEKWSLRTWSKLAVLRAVGYGEGREQRVRALPIPNKLQQELLYKNVSFMEEIVLRDS
ncbi:ankyrin-3 [Elysia marginata]|uniref:Ankyrin-3 n=1 Tax=Elysia marginata TaxID=1093978 RepID=A0AAV4H9Q4_9GAST|nr:ankyrin-3 [Elysia marginata]